MTSKVFVDALAENLDVTKKQAKDLVGIVETTINGLVGAGTEFTVANIKVSTADVPAHTARNPLNGTTVEVPAKKRVKLKALNGIKAAANV